ncbi:MAG: hypothetical protein J6S61_01265 [Elusimicrobiaceae bacterium]|nr:hypothetical protein [Elusimicrobiaceae bacterium]
MYYDNEGFAVTAFYLSLIFLIGILIAIFLRLTMICKHNYKIDLKNNIIKIKNYPVFTHETHLLIEEYIMKNSTRKILIPTIDAIRKYKKYFVVTNYAFGFEFLLPVTRETENLVFVHNDMIQNLIGKQIWIKKSDRKNESKILLNARIIDTVFNEYLQQRLTVIESEEDLIIKDKNHGKILLLFNYNRESNFIADRWVYISVSHGIYKNIRDQKQKDIEHLFWGYLEFI